MAPPILFAVESAVSRSPQLNNTRVVNCFTERQPPSAKSPVPLFGVPGVDLFSTAGTQPCRGAWLFEGVAYFVQGADLWRVSASGSATKVGDGIAGVKRVSMADNGLQICIVNGAQGYIYTPAGGLVQITDDAFYAADTVTFMDGYFIFNRAGTNEWFISALYDGLTYNGLDFASAEAQPGFVLAAVQNLELLFIFTTSHIEIWYNAGTADFPFQRYAGGVIPYGTLSPQAIIKQDGAIFFLGSDHVVYRLQANVPIRVSTHPKEHQITEAPEIASAFFTTYTWEGHKFINLTLPATNATLVFDIATEKWHDRDSWESVSQAGIIELGLWRVNQALQAYDGTLFGDVVDGRIGLLNGRTVTEYGNIIRLLARGAPQHLDRKRLFAMLFELDVEAGVGLPVGQGSDPQVMLKYSRDGGLTWSMQQPWRSMGKIGQYLRRLRWLKMGVARQWVWEITITDPVFRTIISTNVELEPGLE